MEGDQIYNVPVTEPEYNALNGLELREVLIGKMREMMRNHPAFVAALAHHGVEYSIEIKVRSWPYEPGQTHKIQGKGEAAVGGRVPPQVKPKVEKNEEKIGGPLKVEGKVRYPDKEREEANLPVPEKTATADGAISDYASGEDPTRAFDRD